MPLLSEQSETVQDWLKVRQFIKKNFDKRPDINAALFLIGINELNNGQTEFTKEEKQDLMHIATCKLLEKDGFFILERTDEEGWPHYKKVKDLPPMNLIAQEQFLKGKIVAYFKEKGYLQ